MSNFFRQQPAFPELTPQQVAEKLKNGEAVLIDVREPDEYTEAHIAGSKLIPLGQLPTRLNELGDKDTELIMQCRSGGRSGQATAFLLQQGYTNVSNMAGGILEWMQRGLPVER